MSGIWSPSRADINRGPVQRDGHFEHTFHRERTGKSTLARNEARKLGSKVPASGTTRFEPDG